MAARTQAIISACCSSSEQQAIVAHPKVARALDKVVDAVPTCLERVGRVQVLVSEPLVVPRTLRAARQGRVGLDAYEEIDGSLLVGICHIRSA